MVQRVSDAEKQARIVVAELELLAPTHVLAAVHAAHEAALRVEEVQKVGSLMELDDMVRIMRADLSILPGPSQKSSGKEGYSGGRDVMRSLSFPAACLH
jgi:hypothetical protein